MSYGLLGAHRTGKTTLAKAFSAATEIPFVQTSTSEIMKQHDMDPKKDYSMVERLWIQNKILDALDQTYREAPRTFITDRTPLDAAAYLLADVTREGSCFDHKVEEYVQRCIAMTNEHFSTLVLVQPAIPLVDEPGKAPANPAYIEHINQIAQGLANDERVLSKYFFIPRRHTDLDARVACVKFAINRAREKHGIETEDFFANGGVYQ